MIKMVNSIVLLFLMSGALFAITVSTPAGIPLSSEKVKNAIVEKDARLAAFDAEILIFSYSTGKAIYSLAKNGDLQIKEEQGEIEAMIKLKNPKGTALKPVFIKGKGLDAASLTESLAEAAVKALAEYLK
jgi:hypothetical protein